MLLSRTFPGNAGSRALCASVGSREVGTYEKHAQLDGVWKDTVIVERLIPANMPGARFPNQRRGSRRVYWQASPVMGMLRRRCRGGEHNQE